LGKKTIYGWTLVNYRIHFFDTTGRHGFKP
jgi:hypothetical protein